MKDLDTADCSCPDLNLERIAVVYLGARRYTLVENVHAVLLDSVADGMAGLF